LSAGSSTIDDTDDPRYLLILFSYINFFMSTVVFFDIKRFAVHDGPGIRTTLFMKGCPLRCWWCHNPESQSMDPLTVEMERKVNGRSIPATKTYGERAEVKDLMEILLRDRSFYEESGGGITFSGGEPLMQPDGLFELLEACREEGIHTTVDTCGFAPREHFEKILDLTDLFLYDLKNMDPGLHMKYTGVDNKLIHSNADYLIGKGASLIFRIPVIPGINTSGEEVNRMIFFLNERKRSIKGLHLLPYHRIADHKYLRMRIKQNAAHVPEPDQAYMVRMKEKFETTGLEVDIGG
jgi:pyruvate formate lyase activating enzyme